MPRKLSISEVTRRNAGKNASLRSSAAQVAADDWSFNRRDFLGTIAGTALLAAVGHSEALADYH